MRSSAVGEFRCANQSTPSATTSNTAPVLPRRADRRQLDLDRDRLAGQDVARERPAVPVVVDGRTAARRGVQVRPPDSSARAASGCPSASACPPVLVTRTASVARSPAVTAHPVAFELDPRPCGLRPARGREVVALVQDYVRDALQCLAPEAPVVAPARSRAGTGENADGRDLDGRPGAPSGINADPVEAGREGEASPALR